MVICGVTCSRFEPECLPKDCCISYGAALACVSKLKQAKVRYRVACAPFEEGYKKKIYIALIKKAITRIRSSALALFQGCRVIQSTLLLLAIALAKQDKIIRINSDRKVDSFAPLRRASDKSSNSLYYSLCVALALASARSTLC